MGVGVERTLRPNGGKSSGVQRFDRPLLRVVGQFNDLICAGLAEADRGPSTREPSGSRSITHRWSPWAPSS